MGACSSFTCSSTDGRHFLGRTYDEYGTIDANRVAVIPRGHSVALTFTGDERQATDYAVVGMDVAMFPTPLLTDGVNEHGLMGAMLYFPHYCKFNTRRADYDVNAGLLLPFVLGKAANLDEAEKLLKHVNVIDEPSTGMTLPHHYIFSDPSGEAIVAEPLEGGLKVYRHTMGVLTNSPDHNWHLTNLNNYLGTSNRAKPAQLVNGHEISEMGEGSGWFGLPGDYSPASRFVRLAFAKDCMPEPADETDAVTKMLTSPRSTCPWASCTTRTKRPRITSRRNAPSSCARKANATTSPRRPIQGYASSISTKKYRRERPSSNSSSRPCNRTSCN